MTDATPCGIIVKNLGLDDAHGCRLPEAYTGPHEFVTSRGEVIQWETDLNCQCEHCQACEGDYCISYWPKTATFDVRDFCDRCDALLTPGEKSAGVRFGQCLCDDCAEDSRAANHPISPPC